MTVNLDISFLFRTINNLAKLICSQVLVVFDTLAAALNHTYGATDKLAKFTVFLIFT